MKLWNAESQFKKIIAAFLILTVVSWVANADEDGQSNEVEISSVRSGAESASANCSYTGVEPVRNQTLGAFAGTIDIEVRNNRVTKLDARIEDTSCRVSLGAFRQVDVGNNNIVLKNSDQCTVIITFREFTTAANGVVSGRAATNLARATMSFGLLELDGGGCEKLCPELKNTKKSWQVKMDPRTNECTN